MEASSDPALSQGQLIIAAAARSLSRSLALSPPLSLTSRIHTHICVNLVYTRDDAYIVDYIVA